ncbi:MAG: fatty acid--CoA ligase family protein [Bacteroidales bacterium]
MELDFFYDVFLEKKDETAVIYKDLSITYDLLYDEIIKISLDLKTYKIEKGDVVALIGDFTPKTIAVLFSLIGNQNIIVPFDIHQVKSLEKKKQIAGITKTILVENESIKFSKNSSIFSHPFYTHLRNENKPGLVLFTSGTSGEPKAAVHDFTKLLNKFKTRRRTYKTLNFLLFDHWGGLNTMFHTLSNGGVVLALSDRRPKVICEFIEKHKIELLPASPTFLNLLLLSEEYKKYDLGSLKLITYGTEPMPESTLHRVQEVFPTVKLQQTYGLIELGVMRSKSKDSGSLWVKVGGEGFQTRVVDELLEIKADSAMLGYLNAPSPFTDDGWFMTGDQVEVEGEYLKILGRRSEIINVGGEKVYPAEVESVIQELDEVLEVTVYGEKNLIMGNIVCARVRLSKNVNEKEFISHIKTYCKKHLQSFQVPVKIHFDNKEQYGDRYKKVRKTK